MLILYNSMWQLIVCLYPYTFYEIPYAIKDLEFLHMWCTSHFLEVAMAKTSHMESVFATSEKVSL